MAGTEVGRDLFGRRHHVRDVRILRLPERRRDADDDHVALFEHREVRRRRVAAVGEQRQQVRALDVRRVRLTQPQAGHPIDVVVDADHGESGTGELHGEGQTDVPLTDDRDTGNPLLDAFADVHFASLLAIVSITACASFPGSWRIW